MPEARHRLCDAAFEYGQVHIWQFDLDHPDRGRWAETLCAEEFRQAERFVHLQHRERFLQGRCVLRSLLSRYAGVAPRALAIACTQYGKPYLPLRYGLGFNLSHSENLAVIAIGRKRQIGIDIERLVLPDGVRGLARLVFSAEELLSFMALPDDALLLAFFTCWTRKEALVKAIGAGLTLDLRDLNVGLDARPMRVHWPARQHAFSVATLAADDATLISLALGDDGRRRAIPPRRFLLGPPARP